VPLSTKVYCLPNGLCDVRIRRDCQDTHVNINRQCHSDAGECPSFRHVREANPSVPCFIYQLCYVEIACVLFRTPHLSSLFYCPSVNNPCVQDDPLAANPPTSKSPDRKFDVGMDDTRVEKLNTHIPPWLFGICQLVFIDRSSIGNAKIDGLTKGLKLTGKKIHSSNWVVKHFQAGCYLPFLLIY
jgi:hypothetical protein